MVCDSLIDAGSDGLVGSRSETVGTSLETTQAACTNENYSLGSNSDIRVGEETKPCQISCNRSQGIESSRFGLGPRVSHCAARGEVLQDCEDRAYELDTAPARFRVYEDAIYTQTFACPCKGHVMGLVTVWETNSYGLAKRCTGPTCRVFGMVCACRYCLPYLQCSSSYILRRLYICGGDDPLTLYARSKVDGGPEFIDSNELSG
ncbi:hypothetical protein J3F84DRAFT_234916 [Trichoderma pleuroticola]